MAASRTAVAAPAGGLRRIVVIDRDGGRGSADWCPAAGYEPVWWPAPARAMRDGGPHVAGCAQVAADGAAANRAGSAVLVGRPGGHRRDRARVVAAVRDLPADEAVLLHAAACTAALAGALRLVHAVPVSFAERSVGLEAAVAHGAALLDAACGVLAGKEPDVPVTTRLCRARPHELLGADLDADLLVVGGAGVGGHDRLGLVALTALHHAPCPVLLVPR